MPWLVGYLVFINNFFIFWSKLNVNECKEKLYKEITEMHIIAIIIARFELHFLLCALIAQ